jgi:hypothetical protein
MILKRETRMKLTNNFSNDTRNIFLYEHSCFDCNRSDRGLELHHIRGRISDSPLNAIPICMECHAHIGHTQEEESKYLKTALKFILTTDYKLTQKDLEFYISNKALYN